VVSESVKQKHGLTEGASNQFLIMLSVFQGGKSEWTVRLCMSLAMVVILHYYFILDFIIVCFLGSLTNL
jgi:hypothetical protein